jgi:hypothetical protein
VTPYAGEIGDGRGAFRGDLGLPGRWRRLLSEAGPATAANVASKSKFRRAFMSTSVDGLPSLPRTRPSAARSKLYPKCGNNAGSEGPGRFDTAAVS